MYNHLTTNIKFSMTYTPYCNSRNKKKNNCINCIFTMDFFFIAISFALKFFQAEPINTKPLVKVSGTYK